MKRSKMKAIWIFLVIVSMASAMGWELSLDGRPLKASERAWIAEDGQVMVALEDLAPDMIDAYAFDFDGWRITIIAGDIGITAMVTSSKMERDGFAAHFEVAPVVKDKVLWFPIEALAALLNCSVEKNVGASRLEIRFRKDEADGVDAAEAQDRRMTSVANNSAFPRPEIAHFEDLLIPGPRGFISARLYDANPSDSSRGAIYVNIHGGGWRVGSIASSDHVCRDIANTSGVKVLSIEYSMLPEHPFPAGWEDAYAAVAWVGENSQRLGVDPDRILVGGDSAGGNIANAVAMMARDRGVYSVAGLVLAYPVMELESPSASGLFSDPDDARSPYATAKNGSLERMPPTLLLVAEDDYLRPQGEAYADLLERARVPVEFDVVSGTKHGFLATHAESRARVGRFIRAIGK